MPSGPRLPNEKLASGVYLNVDILQRASPFGPDTLRTAENMQAGLTRHRAHAPEATRAFTEDDGRSVYRAFQTLHTVIAAIRVNVTDPNAKIGGAS
jgi:hypothetical protein